MDLTKFILLICCTCYSMASHGSHNIPVEGYDTELQYLGQHVEIPETPVKVIKITKTVAVKIPVPYPVKIVEKVPYPVHVSKPYPVPVPQIIKVPHAVHENGHEALDVSHEGSNQQNGLQFGGHGNAPYQVQESPDSQSDDRHHGFSGQSYDGPYKNHNGNDFSNINVYEGSPSSYHGYGDNDKHSFESQSYDQAIDDYLNKHNSQGGASNYH